MLRQTSRRRSIIIFFTINKLLFQFQRISAYCQLDASVNGLAFARRTLQTTTIGSIESHESIFSLSKLCSRKDKSDKDEKKYTKSNLPSKVCATCGRPFEWRKKWAKVWDEVKYCSDRCRNHRTKSDDFSQLSKPFGSCTLNTSTNKLISFLLSLFLWNFDGISAAAVADSRPSCNEAQHIFSNDYDWTLEASELRINTARLDESADERFYTEPRFVEHIDDKAVKSLTDFHGSELKKLQVAIEKKSLDILDLCSSWVSHVPGDVIFNRFAVLGMNQQELTRNPQATEITVQDLNRQPTLAFESNSFDAVLLQLSIDYLTEPTEVLKETSRVLRPEGKIYISFSNRVFIDKATAMWTGKSDLDHIETVGLFLYKAGFSPTSIQSYCLNLSTAGDPLYVVSAIKIKG
jgi:hypothetical protein